MLVLARWTPVQSCLVIGQSAGKESTVKRTPSPSCCLILDRVIHQPPRKPHITLIMSSETLRPSHRLFQSPYPPTRHFNQLKCTGDSQPLVPEKMRLSAGRSAEEASLCQAHQHAKGGGPGQLNLSHQGRSRSVCLWKRDLKIKKKTSSWYFSSFHSGATEMNLFYANLFFSYFFFLTFSFICILSFVCYPFASWNSLLQVTGFSSFFSVCSPDPKCAAMK